VKLFSCEACCNIIYFENSSCAKCGHRVAYAPEEQRLLALKPDGSKWKAVGSAARRSNSRFEACNWLTPPDCEQRFCLACQHNGTIPDLSDCSRLRGWRDLEQAKHRLFYSLMRWKLPLRTRQQDQEHGLIFNFLADDPNGEKKVMTGHENGVITIALSEADHIQREHRRLQMGEPYRTLLGHFRHEVGHHYWDLLVRDEGQLDACRTLFGDDTKDYASALKEHYAGGPPSDWQESYVSAYATTHPWEDFAETWAHYLHIVDTLEMAADFGMQVAPAVDTIGGLSAKVDFDPYATDNFNIVVGSWLPFVFAMNCVSRTIGLPDIYPFILSPPVIKKLAFIHGLVRNRNASENRSAS
jgi:hypothetical protein